MEAAEQQLWIEYKRGVEAARDQLLEKYLPFAKQQAASLYARRAVNDIEFGDYLHLAYIGLLEAMRRYRHDAAAQFTTFASYRIRGSVLNGIPKMTEIGDQIAHRKRVQHERTASLLGPEGNVPTNLTSMLDLVVSIALTYQIDELLDTDDPNLLSSSEPYSSRCYDEMQNRLKMILGQLPNREEKIIRYHYFHQVPFDEIAKLLNITKSRVSQLHKRALEQIRAALCKAHISELY